MAGVDRLVADFGCSEAVPPVREVAVGGFSFMLDGESVRSIRWQGVEAVRAITWPIRDPNWITLAQTRGQEKFEQNDDHLYYSVRFSVGDGALSCHLEIRASARGNLTAELTMTPSVDFATNRAGFTVLHPIDGVAGTPVELRHSDGSRQAASFPLLISPDQPAMDIVGMRHTVADVEVDLTFSGEVFEMEDQRNWTDASYKTYCVPLVFPFTYKLEAGKTISQKIDLAVSGQPADIATGSGEGVELVPLDETVPQIALALEDGWIGDTDVIDLLRNTRVRCLQVRSGPGHDARFLASACALAQALDAEVEVEIVVGGDAEPTAELDTARRRLDAAGLKPSRVLALPEAYLASHQPSGPWPEGATPREVLAAARAAFPQAEIGGGVLTNFTEFNRCRPDAGACDFISHGTTAIVHASDDRSVLETLEALPHVFASARAIGNDKPYVLGLASIGMRSNPYGAAVAENPVQVRQTMAMYDPRQRGLFGAAFAVGVLAATHTHGVDTVALAAPSGPFGIVSEPQPVPRPYYDRNPAARVYPLYHVVRAATGMQGRIRWRIDNLPAGLCGIAASDGREVRLMIANLSGTRTVLHLPRGSSGSTARILDSSTFEAAVQDAGWIDESEGLAVATGLQLDPLAVLFARLPEPTQ